ASRSYIERISPYHENIEAEASHTYTKSAGPAGAQPAPAPFASAMRPGSATVVLHYSMVKLPEKPMMPREFDPRVGYFTVAQTDFSHDGQRAARRRFITRWRLEKKDPAAALSEPVKPIVYWIDAATPAQWVPYMKRGVEKWQKAFEAAGFKNAIVARLAPTPEQDPDFSGEDARYSVIRWLPSTIENAVGPHVSDPRTGEILDSDIQFYHNVMNLQRNWYFVQVGPLDPRAWKLPLPQDLMGTLIEFVCAHEVGHTLGFQHNMKASSLYPQEKVRDREWVKKMGHTPSIMDYSRYNYVAQPEDKIDVEDLVPGIGPYDTWATRWGYAPIPSARTSEEEKPTLNQWAREQEQTPWYRFSTAASFGSDPGELTEAVGDADAVKSTALGLKNLQRVAEMLLTATTTRTGEPYDDLAELYARMLGQWALEMNHVAAIVGGFDSWQKVIGQEGVIFKPVPKARQAEAVRFLNDNAFATPTWAINPQILRRIEATGALARIRTAQSAILANLLSSPRFARMVEQEALDGADAWAVTDFLAAVRKGVWKELEAPRVKVDAYRRNLQRAYLELANARLNASAAPAAAGTRSSQAVVLPSSGDERPFYRAELKALDAALRTALVRTIDRSTRAHIEGARDQIARILDPKFAASAAAPTVPGRSGWQFDASVETPCWPDYSIEP
ncbi:MAG: zinc-dependent metalloprotease, partial [Acidobacteria bacterium]|nr:zinc-dependent metalloprotease [Acidobacteriota bacterium]